MAVAKSARETVYRTQNWVLTKPAARGRRGMVVSQSREAAEAGAAMLEAGGNAADAAVATAFALAALEPWNSGLGGIGFAQVHEGRAWRGRETVDFGPVAPRRRSTPPPIPLTGGMKQDLFAWPEVEGDRNIHGPLSFVIPSSVAGYACCTQASAGCRSPTSWRPAVALAKRGLPQDWYTTLKVASSAAVLRLYPESARIYLPGGLPPVAALSGQPGLLHARQPAGDAGAAAAGRPARLLRGRDRRRDRRRRRRQMGGVCRPPTSQAARRASCRPSRSPGAAARCSSAGGLTAAPTLAAGAGRHGRCADRQASPPPPGIAQLSPRHARGLCRAAGRPRRRRAAMAGGHLHHPPHRRPTARAMMVAMTTTLLSSMGSRVVLPRDRRADEQRRDVVRPAPRHRQRHRPGQAAAAATCARSIVRRRTAGRGSPSAPRAAGASSPRLPELAFVADFGMDAGGGGASAAHRRLRPDSTSADRRLPDDVLAALAAAGPSLESSSTACCRSTSPART